MDGIPKVGGALGLPLHGAEAIKRIRDREAHRDNTKSFEAELDREAEGGDPEPKPSERREPHPPADEDSGNTLDVVA